MFVALRDIRFAHGRFTLMGAVVALITTLVVFLYGLTGGLAREASSAVAELPANHIVFGAPAGASPTVSFANSTVSAEQTNAWRHTSGVSTAQPLGVAMTRLTAHGGAVSVSALGAPADLLPPLLTGTAPADGQLVVASGLAREHGLTVGDRVSLGSRTLVVSGLSEDRSYGHAPSVWSSMATWQRVSGRSQATALALDGTGDPSGPAARSTRAVSVSDALAGIDGYAAEQGTLRLVQGFLFAVSALVTAAFFIVWTVQRGADVALLKAVGASSRYLVRDALGQAATVLLTGTVVGAGLGLGLGAVAAGSVPFELSAQNAAVPVAAMVLLGLAGSALAVRRVTSVDPLTALGAHR